MLSAFSVMSIAGNAITSRVMTRRDGTPRRASVALVSITAIMGAFIIAMGIVGGGTALFHMLPGVPAFGVLTGLWLGVGFCFGIVGPVGQAYINRHIPSEQRATVLSLSSFFSDGGAIAGQLGLGWLAKTVSYGISYIIGGVAVAASAPLYAASGRAAGEIGRGRAGSPRAVTGDAPAPPASGGSEPGQVCTRSGPAAPELGGSVLVSVRTPAGPLLRREERLARQTALLCAPRRSRVHARRGRRLVQLHETLPQASQAVGLVLVLAALTAADYCDSARTMPQAHGAVGSVD